MAKTTYIIRFADNSSRSRFYENLQSQADVKNKRVEFGEVLPDIIIHDVSDREFQKLNQLAGKDARFMADFQHDLFLPG